MSKRMDFNKLWIEHNCYRNRMDILNRIKKSRTNGYRVEKPPVRLDIRPTNLCNLKCRMCDPYNSSKIEKEQEQMLKKGITSFMHKDYFKRDKRFLNWHKNKEIWNTIYKWSPGIKDLYFTGGEPILIKEVWNFIDYLKEKELAKNIRIEFNTNCTQKTG